MNTLADFLDEHGASIIDLFTQCARRMIAPGGAATSELVDHLPQILAELSASLRAGGKPTMCLFEHSDAARQHGKQRLRLGYNLDAVVREYGLLRDCIFEHLERRATMPSLRELRMLTDELSAATAESVSQYVRDGRALLDAERRQVLDLFEQAPGFVCFLRGRDLVFERANAAYYQLVGHRELIGKPLREALPEVAGQGFFDLLEQVLATGEAFVGHAMRVQVQREPNGPLTDAFVDLVYQPIRLDDGEVIGILVQGHDVSEGKRQEAKRREVEETMHESERRYRTVFESIDDGYCLMQMIPNERGEIVNYRFVEANRAFEQQSGLRDAVGHTVRDLVPTLDESWFEIYGKVALTGEPRRFENHAPAMGRWFDSFASRVGDPALLQVAVVFKDITDRKAAEAERERLFALERAARSEAEAANRLRDEFLATVSHELRTPLSAILGWTQMLRAGNVPADKHDRALETVERNARAQAQLIEDLLDVSRILAGKLRLEVEPLVLDGIVAAALETVQPAAEAKDIRIQATCARDCRVMADPHRFQQVVWNLVSNAVKFTPRGGLVQIAVDRDGDAATVTVTDTGRGIAKELQEHIFDRFRQADGSTTRSHGGLGLGLSIVRQLVEMHGGTVSVASDGEGRGARFTVRLPLAETNRRGAVQTISAPSANHTAPVPIFERPPELLGISVLVVDDELDTRELIGAVVESCGARPTLAGSAAEALARIAESRPDLILSDIGMPGEDGYAFLRKLRALPAAAGGDIPAIALTAFARAQDRARALQSGFNSYIAKPVDPTELFAVMVSLRRALR